jgi:hypothetical protein
LNVLIVGFVRQALLFHPERLSGRGREGFMLDKGRLVWWPRLLSKQKSFSPPFPPSGASSGGHAKQAHKRQVDSRFIVGVDPVTGARKTHLTLQEAAFSIVHSTHKR